MMIKRKKLRTQIGTLINIIRMRKKSYFSNASSSSYTNSSDDDAKASIFYFNSRCTLKKYSVEWKSQKFI